MTGAPAYPPAPWHLVGQMWVSLFRVPRAAGPARPAGLHAAAFVSYEEGGSLTYSELLVAHRAGGPQVCISDIWVDSPVSQAGGRDLWAIPKDLADLARVTTTRGPVARTSWTAGRGAGAVARACFADVSRVGPRVPVRAATRQPALDRRGVRTAAVRGSAKVLPCRGTWDIDPAGPLAWLAGHRPLASFRLVDFRVSVG